jgi:hypothetical protein
MALFKNKKEKNTDKKEFADLKEVAEYIESLENKMSKLSEEMKALKEASKFAVQKIGIIRFNPFSATGGDQSFAVALLDDNNDGVTITSIYSAHGCRVYSKPVVNGASEYTLSNEEKDAIKKAANLNDKTK